MQQAFWDDYWDRDASVTEGRIDPSSEESIATALQYFGDIRGKKIIDLGCGPGLTSLRFAEAGAEVYALDISERAIQHVRRIAAARGLANLHAVHGDVKALAPFGKFDFIYGKFILHHIEPFRDFAWEMACCMAPGGKGFFSENNAASRALVWARNHLVGKLWIPKYGDPDEFPLTPQEVDELRLHFKVTQRYPEMFLFSLVGIYLFRNRLTKPFEALDAWCKRHDVLRRYSYRQDLYLERL